MCHLYFDDNGNDAMCIFVLFVCPFLLLLSVLYLFCVTVKRHQIWIYDILDLFRCHLLGLSFVSRASKKET